MFLALLRALVKVLFVFRDYEPQKVTLWGAVSWVKQFAGMSRFRIFSLLDSVIYLSKEKTLSKLVELNSGLLGRLRREGIAVGSVVYISTGDAGSSSHIMLGMLRDTMNLERAGAQLLVSSNFRKLIELTSEGRVGAIIYVDDFTGSGRQFSRDHREVAQWIATGIPEFLIVPVICEEGHEVVVGLGVEPVVGMIHRKLERPLHPYCNEVPEGVKSSLYAIFEDAIGIKGLGFGELATMVVFYRNAPNSMPLLFRGTIGQKEYRGIFPRWDDLPQGHLDETPAE